MKFLFYTVMVFILSCIKNYTVYSQDLPRIYMKDIEGIWVEENYAGRLSKLKMPHRTAKKIDPSFIIIKKEGASYPLIVTNFNKAFLQIIIALESQKNGKGYQMVLAPDQNPISSSEAKYLRFRGNKGRNDTFENLEFYENLLGQGAWKNYKYIGKKFGNFFNKTVISGTYKDEKNNIWIFENNGSIQLPENKRSYYEISVNDVKSNCEYIEIENLKSKEGVDIVGFSWK